MTDSVPKPAFVTLAGDEQVHRHVSPEKLAYGDGIIPAMTRLLLTHETIGPAFRDLYQQIMFKPGALSRAEREMVAGVAAAAQDCFY